MKTKLTLCTAYCLLVIHYSQKLNPYTVGPYVSPTSKECTANSAKKNGAFIGLYSEL
jgi:hypothetical protein